MEDPVIENLKTICLCNNIKKGTILKAVHSGCHTVDAINRKLGTGSGDCKGERCGPKIKGIIEEFTTSSLPLSAPLSPSPGKKVIYG